MRSSSKGRVREAGLKWEAVRKEDCIHTIFVRHEFQSAVTDFMQMFSEAVDLAVFWRVIWKEFQVFATAVSSWLRQVAQLKKEKYISWYLHHLQKICSNTLSFERMYIKIGRWINYHNIPYSKHNIKGIQLSNFLWQNKNI